ncbi:SagB/ThcOx family dehydrogenase [Beggiatoa leptomitoformis]|uniref:SagB/ThcOx family dehydrogenase n=1 Tax=Beggiatoa leptomitoformis TaxID=288004 RepID=A0A2N9YGZ9_9GAMM|nr:SagB/ThcOx family dehydrogenase [Beggiatoa leptomitoformis]ALG67927.1 SagB/ThcOx family dehydrogenase [Beggiatoa leptomitoformis]AUI69802.1 SagB/ThcOx family dehydrogenase [Beggiatoa leptomitoformis]
MQPTDTQNTIDTIITYHNQTKHQPEQYAAGPDFMDWIHQPNPFRTFTGAPRIELPLCADQITTLYTELYQADITPKPLNKNNIATLLELSLGLSAWKQYGNDQWSLRCNPSSGNLHPTEGYVFLPPLTDLPAGVYHYNSHDHALEQRAEIVQMQHADFQQSLPSDCFLLGLSSITWREAWKYGERAFRYCQHDIGHALGAITYAARSLGWDAQILINWSDDDIAQLFGLNHKDSFAQAEKEVPEVVLCIKTQFVPNLQQIDAKLLHNLLKNQQWFGQANILSKKKQFQWDIIDVAVKATEKPQTTEIIWRASLNTPLLPLDCCSATTNTVIRQRRSAQQFDGTGVLNKNAFFRILDSLLPRKSGFPFTVLPQMPAINLVLFVHRVTDMSSGLYILIRQQDILETLQAKMRAEFQWEKPADCPSHLPLYRLVSANARKFARSLSCHQDIAADSAFSLGMIADFSARLEKGAWQYRRLFWEAGLIGQVLYLEAEAAGYRGTGIGCYFDDAMHNTLGLSDLTYQSLYHFTIGKALEDHRLNTLEPYAHLKNHV